MDLDPIKQDIVTASHILHRQGIAAAFGHLSARIPGTDTFIFPPRMSPALVRLDNLLVLDVEGNQLSGDGRPNTEFWIHARIYKARPDIQSVCHVHPPSCVILGSLGKPLDRCTPPAPFSKIPCRFSIRSRSSARVSLAIRLRQR